MKALLGVVSLLVVLAFVGLIAVRQLKAVGQVGGPATAADAGLPLVPQTSGSGTVRQQAGQLEHKVADDVVRALNQAAEARRDESEKP